MNKGLHDIDELFRSALDHHEENPSAGVKENIDAALDRKNAEEYKKRFLLWKRAALLLLLLLAGLLIYESGVWKTGSAYPDKRTADKQNNPADENQNPVYQNTAADNTNDDKLISTPGGSMNDKPGEKLAGKDAVSNNNLFTPLEQKEISSQVGIVANHKRAPEHKISKHKEDELEKKSPDKQISLIVNQNSERTYDQSIFNKNTDNFQRNSNSLLKEKRSLPQPVEKSDPEGGIWLFAKSVKRFTLPAVNDSLLKSSSSKNKKTVLFKPFWAITGLVSYDNAGYMLDSDQPSAVKSIKFREAHEPSFSIGAMVARQLTSRFSLQSGLVYTNIAIGMKPQKTYAFTDPTGDVAYKYITSSGYAFFKPGFGPQPNVGDSLTTAEAKHRMENISIPLLVKLTVPGKRITISPGAGIEANFITKANLEVDIEDPSNREIVVVRKLSGIKSFYWSFIADAEIKYNLTNKLSLNIRPVYRRALSPITKNNVVETFPHSVGLGAGVTIRF